VLVDQGFLYRATEKGPDSQFGDADPLRQGFARIPDTFGESRFLTVVKTSDGSLLVGGQLTGMTNRRLIAARYDSAGKLDATFADKGWARAQQQVDTETFKAVAAHGADHVLIAAQRITDASTHAAVVLRLVTRTAHTDGASRSWP